MSTLPEPLVPGIYDGIDNDDYHGGPGISKSGLDLVDRSPGHYWERYMNPEREEDTNTDAQLVGSAIHCALLEPDAFDARYWLGPKVSNRGTNQWKDAAAAAQEDGASLLLPKQYEYVMRMQRDVFRHPKAAYLLEAPGRTEVSGYAIDEETGELVRVRWDKLLTSGYQLDIKKTQDARPDAFAKSVANFRYHVQQAMYSEVYAMLHDGLAPQGFIFLVIEERPPHAVRLYTVKAHDERIGSIQWRENLRTYHECRVNEHWPLYPENVQEIELPFWARKKMTME